jgi:hypothetical protein
VDLGRNCCKRERLDMRSRFKVSANGGNRGDGYRKDAMENVAVERLLCVNERGRRLASREKVYACD